MIDIYKKGMDVLEVAVGQIQRIIAKDVRPYVADGDWIFSDLGTAEYCFEEEYEGESFTFYAYAAEWCKDHGIDLVCDIGCCCGYQGEFFKQAGVRYVGIDTPSTRGYMYQNAWNQYRIERYPFRIENHENYAAVSNLCIGYFGDTNAMIRQLKHDFDTIIFGSCAHISGAFAREYDLEVLEVPYVFTEASRKMKIHILTRR